MLRPKNKGVGPKPCFMTGCLSRGGSLKVQIWLSVRRMLLVLQRNEKFPVPKRIESYLSESTGLTKF